MVALNFHRCLMLIYSICILGDKEKARERERKQKDESNIQAYSKTRLETGCSHESKGRTERNGVHKYIRVHVKKKKAKETDMTGDARFDGRIKIY